VDIIVSEWMGFFLLFEDMLPDVITFRDKYLTQNNGLIMPSEARFWGALYNDDHWHQSRIKYWQDVYGFDYTPILEKVKSEQFENPERMHLRSNGLISTPSELFKLNLYTTSIEDLREIQTRFQGSVTRDATVHGVAFWFDVLLEGPHHKLLLDTSAAAGYNTWSQVLWHMVGPRVQAGDDLRGALTISRRSSGSYDLSMKVEEPFETSLESLAQNAGNLYQDMYERLEIEHAMYRHVGHLWDFYDDGVVAVAAICCLSFGIWVGTISSKFS